MGLEGTLKVFSLTEIFQMLGLQRKTGILSVEGEDDTVTISFLGGLGRGRRVGGPPPRQPARQPSAAGGLRDAGAAGPRARASRRRRASGWASCSFARASSSRQELREALRLQISRIVYTAFRWPDGRFHFTQEGTVDYDADHMAPVSTDTVLMEAAQIVDEWPLRREEGRVAARRSIGALRESRS